MGEMFANVTVAYQAHSDRRFELLGQLAGWSRWEALGRMVELWARCTALQTDRPPAQEIRIHLGLRGEQLLVDAALGERCADGMVRVLGGGLTGGDTDRFSWYEPVREQARAAGVKRAQNAVRGPRGQFQPSTGWSSDRPATTSGSATAGPAVTSGSPAVTSAPPASGFRIPDQREDLSPARAIPPSPESAPVPAAVPAPAPPPAPPDPARERRQILRAAIWSELAAAREAVAIELRLPEGDRKLMAFDPGERALGLRLSEARTDAELDLIAQQARKAIAVIAAEARVKRSVEWLTGSVFESDRAWRRAIGKSLAEAKRPPPAARGSAPTTAPAPTRAETEAPVLVSKAELSDVARMAAEARAMLFGATDGARAPPAIARPHDEHEQPEPARTA